ncbi:MAG: fused MFS/spermidine synthase, partial [Gemmataceae bacterium]|nr:fused MFS/spermidine synthase [Gemmataceae bacterium]
GGSRGTVGDRATTGVGDGATTRPALSRRLRWLVLAFVPSSLMLSVTTHITTDIAPVPLLWVVPLGIYLFTFTLVFSSRSLDHRTLVRGAPIVVFILLLVMLSETADPVWLLMGVHLLGLFVLGMVCHGELARDRPAVEYLTGFYLWLSLGGVLGGVFNTLIAPLLFPGHAEYPLVLVVACLLLPPTSRRAAQPQLLLDVALPVGLGLVTVGLVLLGGVLDLPAGPERAAVMVRTAVMFALPVVVCYIFADRPLRFGLGVGAVFLASLLAPSIHGRIVYQERSFFGVHRVAEDPQGRLRVLVHGGTVHGRQSLDRSRRREPLAYYHKDGPAGSLFSELERRPNARIGLVGLGAGSLAAYGQPGQELTYYEIDPAVVRIARKYFTFLKDCPAGEPKVIEGDARLTLADAPAGHYHLLVIDAFSSDAIPLHLLTREALQLYLAKLAPDGILAFHISNRYLGLETVLADLAKDAALFCRWRDLPGVPGEGKDRSQWVVLARRDDHLGQLARKGWNTVRADPGRRVWTDDYSNLLQVFRWLPPSEEM